MTSLTSKRTVSLLVSVPALLLLLGASRTWLTGRTTEPLIGGGVVSASGSQLAPGVVALGLVCLASLVAMLTGGPRIRRIASVVTVLAAGGALALLAGTLADPVGALGRVAASTVGRTGTVQTTADPTWWLWLTVAAAVVLLASAVLGVVAVGRWAGLSARFESPVDPAIATDVPADGGAGPGTHRSAWDEMSDGRDPTASAEAGQTSTAQPSTGEPT